MKSEINFVDPRIPRRADQARSRFPRSATLSSGASMYIYVSLHSNHRFPSDIPHFLHPMLLPSRLRPIPPSPFVQQYAICTAVRHTFRSDKCLGPSTSKLSGCLLISNTPDNFDLRCFLFSLHRWDRKWYRTWQSERAKDSTALSGGRARGARGDDGDDDDEDGGDARRDTIRHTSTKLNVIFRGPAGPGSGTYIPLFFLGRARDANGPA